MFDVDGSRTITYDEFLVIERIFEKSLNRKQSKNIFLDKRLRKVNINTTLKICFFGARGDIQLYFADFKNFLVNLQTEVLESEFHEFSKGSTTISEIDFAKLLVRYSYNINSDEYKVFLDKVQDMIEKKGGITFDEFYIFCRFLNHMENFAVVVNLVKQTNQNISKDELHRAVKIFTRAEVSGNFVNTVCTVFGQSDELNFNRMKALMHYRRRRRFKSQARLTVWKRFKQCVREQMKSS
uniref:Calcium uptake protein 3, mitochondrial-like n=1 Tax=Diabrotica virgifera virgifera TaxID=50390 RepID=A0A6P7GI93_DIAVI